MQNRFGARGFQVVGVTKAAQEDALTFVRETGANYPVLAGARDVFDDFGISILPAAKLIDPRGEVAADARKMGFLSSQSDEIEYILGERLAE